MPTKREQQIEIISSSIDQLVQLRTTLAAGQVPDIISLAKCMSLSNKVFLLCELIMSEEVDA